MMATLVAGPGIERGPWGTDAVRYRAPRRRIAAFRRVEVPGDPRDGFGWSALGDTPGAVE